MLDPRIAAFSVASICHFDSSVVLLLAGPRLDGARLDGISAKPCRCLARRRRGYVRSRPAARARRRRGSLPPGLTELARDLAAAATVSDVLRSLTTHAARLLNADTASLWRSGPDGGVAVVGRARHAHADARFLREVLDARQARGRERDWTERHRRRQHLAFAVDDGADEPVVCLVHRGAAPRALRRARRAPRARADRAHQRRPAPRRRARGAGRAAAPPRLLRLADRAAEPSAVPRPHRPRAWPAARR